MQSRKSSILKPRKVREPLQDLNQLLPNNDDDETTTTDVQRRRVSFASMNKVKEYETAPECVPVITAPPVCDKRYSLSTDLYQPPISGRNPNETYQTITVSRKSIQNTLKVNATRLSIPDENICLEDVELTETIGRIYDIPMKSSGDSSMEITHVITQSEVQYDRRSEGSEVLGPLNLTKENLNQTGSFADAHIVEIEIVKNDRDPDTSSMETTEVISNNLIRIENPDFGTFSMETTDVIRNNVIRVEKPESSACSMDITEIISPNLDTNGDDSSMETTDVICDHMLSESLKSQSAFFETMQSSQAFDDTNNRDEDIEYISVRNFESPSALPKRKSIFEMSTRPSTNWEGTQMPSLHHDNSSFGLRTKMATSDNSKLIVCNDSLSLTCQEMTNRIDDSISNTQMLSEEVEQRLNITNRPGPTETIVEEVQFNTGIIRTSTQDTNKTKCELSMPLLSQEAEKNKSLSVKSMSLTLEKTKCNNSNMELLTQEDNKTKCNNSNMELLTQEDNKTKCNNSNMELLSQEENKTKYPNSNMELTSHEDNKTKYNNPSMELLTQEEKTECHQSALELSLLEDVKNLDNSVRVPLAEEKSHRLSTSISPLLHDETVPAEKSCVSLKLHEIMTPVKPADSSECTAGLLNLSTIIPPEVDAFTEVESVREPVDHAQNAYPENCTQPQPTTTDVNVRHETSLKSSQEDDSSANDSNSPLTVGVNFSIFQKNKETRVEFSGTIDSNKKKKSISNVKVNIINNKTEKTNKHVKELRFSMPATLKSRLESEIQKPEFSATFTDFSIPNEELSPALDNTAAQDKTAVQESNAEKVHAECPLPVEEAGPVSLNSSHTPTDDMSNIPVAKPAKKRLSDDAFYGTEETELCPKRRSLCNDSPGGNTKARTSCEVAAANASGLLSEAESGSGCHSLNQSSSQEEINDYSLHNPSIIVNVGDSFSHYKSMDLGTDNAVSASDVRESVADENEAKPVCDYIDSDDISKENFVVEWLQNKTGKTNVDTRLFSSSSDSSSLSTVKSMTRGSEKSSTTTISDTVRTASREGSQKTSPEVTTDLVETDEKDEDTSKKVVEEYQNTPSEVEEESLPGTETANTEPTVPEQTVFAVPQPEEMEINEDNNDASSLLQEITNEEKPASIKEVAAVEMSIQEEGTTGSDVATNVPVISSADDVSASSTNDSNGMDLSDENDSTPLVDGEPDTTNTYHPTPTSCTDEVKPKSTSKTRLSVDPVFVSSESMSEKRQKMSPEYESNRIETEQIFENSTRQRVEAETEPAVENTVPVIELEAKLANEQSRKQNQVLKPRNVFDVVSEDKNEAKVPTKPDRNQNRHRKFAATKKDILEKIEVLKNDKNQKWKLKVASEDEWVFQFFFDQLELCIKFDGDEKSNLSSAVCQYVQPSYVKFYEISKIAVEYLIRKNEAKMKKICQTVEDVPYLLKLIEPDVIYIENFVTDVLRLCESEIFKIKNGRAVFYVYSFKNLLSAKVQVNISRLERLSIKDIQVEDIVGKADLNLIRSTFSEAGRGSDFISKFVNKLWIVLDE